MTTGTINVWRECLKTDRRIYESMSKLEATAILEEAATMDLSGVSVLNKEFTRRQMHEIMVAAVRSCAGETLQSRVAKNIVREFVLKRKRI